jgi:hypothetical protein
VYTSAHFEVLAEFLSTSADNGPLAKIRELREKRHASRLLVWAFRGIGVAGNELKGNVWMHHGLVLALVERWLSKAVCL